jgi:hypothetical protein
MEVATSRKKELFYDTTMLTSSSNASIEKQTGVKCSGNPLISPSGTVGKPDKDVLIMPRVMQVGSGLAMFAAAKNTTLSGYYHEVVYLNDGLNPETGWRTPNLLTEIFQSAHQRKTSINYNGDGGANNLVFYAGGIRHCTGNPSFKPNDTACYYFASDDTYMDDGCGFTLMSDGNILDGASHTGITLFQSQQNPFTDSTVMTSGMRMGYWDPLQNEWRVDVQHRGATSSGDRRGGVWKKAVSTPTNPFAVYPTYASGYSRGLLGGAMSPANGADSPLNRDTTYDEIHGIDTRIDAGAEIYIILGECWTGTTHVAGEVGGRVCGDIFVSRDGSSVSRISGSALIPNGTEDVDWDGGFILPDANLVNYGNYSYIFYGANRQRQSNTQEDIWKIGAIRFGKERLAGLRISSGNAVTQDYTGNNGKQLEINANVSSGNLKVELQTPSGTPITGYTEADCTAITGDNYNRIVSWGAITALPSQDFRVKYVASGSTLLVSSQFVGSALLSILSGSFSISGAEISASDLPAGIMSVSELRLTSNGGTIKFDGTHAARFSLSLDGNTWGSTIAITQGTQNFYVGCTPQNGDTTLTARLGVPQNG